MALVKRGFVLFDEVSGRFGIDRTATNSLIVSCLLLDRIIEASVHAEGMLLDVGCGVMPYKELFRPRVRSHIGTDWPNTLHNNPEIDVYSTNTALPFADESFETVLCTEVLEHSPEPGRLMCELARVLKTGGRAVITAPFFYWVHEQPWDYYRYTSFAFEDLAAKAGLEVVYIRPVGGPVSVMADVASKLALQYFRPGVSVFFQRAFMKAAGLTASFLKRRPRGGFFGRVLGVQSRMAGLISLGHIMVARKKEPT